MTDDEPAIRADEVVFDPEAVAELLAEDPHPAHAFQRFPRKLLRALRRGRLFYLRDEEPQTWKGRIPIVLVTEEEARRRADEGRVVEAGQLLVPSGRLLGATPLHPDEPASRSLTREVAEIPPGQYRLRLVWEHEDEEMPSGVDAAEAPHDLLSEEDRAALAGYERLSQWGCVASLLLVAGVAGIASAVARLAGDAFLTGGWSLAFLAGGVASAAYFCLLSWAGRRPAVRAARQHLEEAEDRSCRCQEIDRPDVCLLSRIGPVSSGSSSAES